MLGRKTGAVSTMYFSFPLAKRAGSPRPARSMIYRDHTVARGRILYRDKLVGLRARSRGYPHEIKSGLVYYIPLSYKTYGRMSLGIYMYIA